MDGDRVVQLAKGWIGTPWHHQGRIKGIGADCIGLIIGVARELGWNPQDITNYSREPNGLLKKELDRQLIAVKLNERFPGNVGHFEIGGRWEHVGIFGYNTLIHIHQSLGKCIEHVFDLRLMNMN